MTPSQTPKKWLRFGPEPDRRLDQAFGRVSKPIEPIRPEEIVEQRRNFAEPIASGVIPYAPVPGGTKGGSSS